MELDLNRTVKVRDLIRFARELISDDGTNKEYDRAICELIADAAGLTQDDYRDVALVIGVKENPWT